MPIYLFYVYVGPYLWGAQVIAVIALGALGWRAPAGLPASLQGHAAASIAVALAGVFTGLVAPVALMLFMRRNNRAFPVEWTDPPGLVCMAQVLLLIAAGVNAAILQRAR